MIPSRLEENSPEMISTTIINKFKGGFLTALYDELALGGERMKKALTSIGQGVDLVDFVADSCNLY